MAPTVGSAPLKGAPDATPLGSTSTIETQVPAQKAKGTAGVFGSDAIDAQKVSLEIRSVKPAAISGAEVTGATVRSEFPITDLGQIQTTGRYAQGFRLDGGSLRLMWMNVRRTLDKNNKPGFELFFQAQGATIENYKKRLEQAGATAGSYKFSASDVEEPTPGKAVAKQNTNEWGPSSQKSLNLSQADKWSVDMVTTEPEALKGAVRIKVYGDDAEATAALQDVIKKLGLQNVFAPPAPNALERFKILRFMWQVAPGAADHLRFKTLELLKETLPEAVNLAEPDPAKLKEVDEAKFDDAAMKERAQLATALFEKSPTAFLTWAKSQNPLTTATGSDPNYSLKSAVKNAGVAEGSEAWNAALAKPVVEEDARTLLELGVLAKHNGGAADALILRDLEQVKVSELQDALKTAGIDPLGDRVKNLRFEEVYPGYFTVVDPALPDILKASGARYLYSTADNPERVWTMLLGGQKSSLTRFQEGLIIQGKSSSSDFTSGGATSVFSRLVPDSIIQKAKKDKSAPSSYGDTSFYDWGGSRPFKLILNRRILARTDWYAYNGDNFGRTTTLKAENHGERIVNTINGSFSRSNEVMFPIGNDPSYVDFVVAPTEEKKKELVEFLTQKGMTEINGKKVEDFVIVRAKLFEHPDDMTLEQAVKDAIADLNLSAHVSAAAEAGKTAAIAALDKELGPLVEGLFAGKAKDKLTESAQSTATSRVNSEAQSAVVASADALTALNLPGIEDKAIAAVLGQAQEAMQTYLLNPTNYSYAWNLESDIRNATNAVVNNSISAVGQKAMADFVATASYAPGTTRETVQNELLAAIVAALTPVLSAAMEDKGGPAGLKSATSMVDGARASATSNARTAVSDAALEAGTKALDAAALAALTDAAIAVTKEKATASTKSAMEGSANSWMSNAFSTEAKEAAQSIALKIATEAATPAFQAATQAEISAAAEKATETYSQAYPEKVTTEEKAKIPGAIQEALNALLKEPIEKGSSAAISTAVSQQIQKGADAMKAGTLLGEVAAALVEARAPDAVAEAIKSKVKAQITGALSNKLGDQLAPTFNGLRDQAISGVLEAAKKRVLEALVTTHKNQYPSYKLKDSIDAIMAKIPPAPPPETPPAAST